MSQLVITKALAKAGVSIGYDSLYITHAFHTADYTAKQPHVELAERMKQRDAG